MLQSCEGLDLERSSTAVRGDSCDGKLFGEGEVRDGTTTGGYLKLMGTTIGEEKRD